MEPQRQTFSLAGAGSVLIGFTTGCIAAGVLVGWLAGSVKWGLVAGALIGVPAGVAATVFRYRNI